MRQGTYCCPRHGLMDTSTCLIELWIGDKQLVLCPECSRELEWRSPLLLSGYLESIDASMAMIDRIEVWQCERDMHCYSREQAIVRRRKFAMVAGSDFVCDQPDTDPKSGFKKCGGFIRPAAG